MGICRSYVGIMANRKIKWKLPFRVQGLGVKPKKLTRNYTRGGI